MQKHHLIKQVLSNLVLMIVSKEKVGIVDC
jgi:hypothetical protein